MDSKGWEKGKSLATGAGSGAFKMGELSPAMGATGSFGGVYAGNMMAGIIRPDPFSGGLQGVQRVPARFDGSREQFNVSRSSKVSEVLMALPFVHADPVYASPMTNTTAAQTMQVLIRFLNTAPTEPDFYDASNSPTVLGVRLSDNAITPPVRRLGMSFTVLDTDAMATAANTSTNAFDFQAQASTIAVLRKLDKAIAQGTGAEAVPAFYGLNKLCALGVLNRTDSTSNDIESDARNIMAIICPDGYGPGEGIDCFIGGPKVMRKLMSTASGQRGASGWRVDARTGRLVYHYMGIPYYRVETDESVTGKLYGANLGPTGLSLVHGLATPRTYGLQIDVFTNPGTAIIQAVVHGSFALVAWEAEAIYEITGISIASL